MDKLPIAPAATCCQTRERRFLSKRSQTKLLLLKLKILPKLQSSQSLLLLSLFLFTLSLNLVEATPAATHHQLVPLNGPQYRSRFQQQQQQQQQSQQQQQNAPRIVPPTPVLEPSTVVTSPRLPIVSGQLSQQNQMVDNQYTKATLDILLALRLTIINKSVKFNDDFKQLLSNSKRSLHQMFIDTYGLIYERNTEIFTQMFEGLEQYYAHGYITTTTTNGVNINKLEPFLEQFFERLYQKIFQVVNTNVAFEPNYLTCATAQLAHLRPFGDMPDRLIKGMKNAFVAGRSFYQALNNGVDVIKNIVLHVPSTQCSHLMSEKLLKPLLQQTANQTIGNWRQQLWPCQKFCEEVMGRCVGKLNLDELHSNWKAYVQTLTELATKMGTSHNFEAIIAPLDVQISEAIMNFQENAQNISNQVFATCGKPTPIAADPFLNHHEAGSRSRSSQGSYRHRRATAGAVAAGGRSAGNGLKPMPTSSSLVARLPPPPPPPPPTTSIPEELVHHGDKKSPSMALIDEIKDYMLSTKSIWQQLPSQVCVAVANATGATYSVSEHQRANNNNKLVLATSKNCFSEPFAISDINTDMRHREEMRKQINRLIGIRQRLEEAITGREVDWSGSSMTAGPMDTAQNHLPPIGRPTATGRHPSIVSQLSSTTTTTTTTLTPNEDDEEGTSEDTGDDLEETSSGEGEIEDFDRPNDEDDAQEDLTADNDEQRPGNLETPPTNHDLSANDTSLWPASSSSNPPFNDIEQPPSGNHIDPLDSGELNIISPPNLGAQKSSQSSSMLVISNDTCLMIVLGPLAAALALLLAAHSRHSVTTRTCS